MCWIGAGTRAVHEFPPLEMTGSYATSVRLPSPPGHGASPDDPALSERRLSYLSWTAVSSSTATNSPLDFIGGFFVVSSTWCPFLLGSARLRAEV